MDGKNLLHSHVMTDVNMVRGIRGAITVPENSPQSILDGTRELLEALLKRNGITDTTHIASIIFSTTPDLNAAFPAAAGRELGLITVPLICYQEIGVPGALAKCVRVLLHLNTTKQQSEIAHVYLRGAVVLRPDLT